MGKFSVRIVVCDHYMSAPTSGQDVTFSEFRGCEVKQVPILRIFGSALDGFKTCLHVHGVFPYFYIPCANPRPEPQFLYQIANSLDRALNISLKQATSREQHVYKITLVRGIPFYGYHTREHLFFKIYLYNPGHLKQAVELFQNGAILGQAFQAYEAHLNFTLQFFIDFNLFGMSCIDLAVVKFRRKSEFSQHGKSLLANEIIEKVNLETIKPISKCFYEVDCLACDILNRQRMDTNDGQHNPGLNDVWYEEKKRRKNIKISLNQALSPSQQREGVLQADTHEKFKNIFFQRMILHEKDIRFEGFDSPMSSVLDPIIKSPCGLGFSDVLNNSIYPVENSDLSICSIATDVIFHHPTASCNDTSDISRGIDNGDTIVDEALALNCSISQGRSQVTFGSDDAAFIEMLESMEDKPDDDSIIGSQINQRNSPDDNDRNDDYMDLFQEDEIVISLRNDVEHHSLNHSNAIDSKDPWADSFWDGVDNIAQLDGTVDDLDQITQSKSLKRNKCLGVTRKRSSKLKSKQNINDKKRKEKEVDCSTEENTQEKFCINESFSTTSPKCSIEVHNKVDSENKYSNLPISYIHDLQNNFFPQPGGSNSPINKLVDLNTSTASNPGIDSFYNMTDVDYLSQISSHSLSSEQNTTQICQRVVCNRKSKNKEGSAQNQNSVKYIKSEKDCMLRAAFCGPNQSQLLSTLKDYDLPEHRYNDPFYSNYNDVTRGVEIGSVVMKLLSNSVLHLKPFDSTLENVCSIEEWRRNLFLSNNTSQNLDEIDNLDVFLATNRKTILRTSFLPPSVDEVRKWLEKNHDICEKDNIDAGKSIEEIVDKSVFTASSSCIEDKKETDIGDCRYMAFDNSSFVSNQLDGSFLCQDSQPVLETQNLDKTNTISEHDFLTLMVIELHTSVRGRLNPDPEFDKILAVFYKITIDSPTDHLYCNSYVGIIAVDNVCNPLQKSPILEGCGIDYHIDYVNSENELVNMFLKIFHRADPDIICGYEIEMHSWGFLIERCHHLGMNLIVELSRVEITKTKHAWRNSQESSNDLKLIGRVVFSLWRLLRHEVALGSYSFENTMFYVLNERVPLYNFKQLSDWWNHSSNILRWITVEFYMKKIFGTFQLMDKIDLIKRTSELARLFGLQWWEVFSRGSQFRVESLMLRAARPLNLIAFSPSVSQRASMRAPECLPLIFEPESRFYSDPVIVLDFQSLYPSMMIAYNYCFSTCLGRVQNMGRDSAYEFGAWQLRISPNRLKKVASKDLINWSPVGVGFVKPEVRRGVLPALLKRILAARQAVKKGIKLQSDETVKKAMNARQLGLKLIANVTYGYTAANFSGRMPCVEVADSVVAKGRETLERAIKLVENTTKWSARVVYGDTDSMFVLVKGRSVDQAFEIGAEIAAAVTADNPSPVALKLEKVYQPCILQTKKRYVGYLYESANQKIPEFEAKGIETVRRDGCPASVKMLKKALQELFDSRDMSKVRNLVCSQLSSLIEGAMPILDLVFTREFHGFKGYKRGTSAPPLEIAKRLLAADRRAVPRLGERVGWIVTAGAPGSSLLSLARSRSEMEGLRLQPHVTYYIMRAILPPLARCLSLLGVNVFQWYDELPRYRNIGIGGIAQYLWKETCSACGVRSFKTICDNCMKNPTQTMFALQDTLRNYSTKHKYLSMICKSCCGNQFIESCEANECPVFWKRATISHYFEVSKECIQQISTEYQ